MTVWKLTKEILIVVGALTTAACGRVDEGQPAPPPPVQNNPAAKVRQIVLCLGTSLTAGPGLDPSQTWSALLQLKADSAGLPYQFVNAGVSGETSAGALARSDWLFGQGPIAILIVETGANDGLRGQSVDSLSANLDAILGKAEVLTPTPRIVIAAMEALPNMGRDYVRRFRAVYPAMAKKHHATLMPFLLNGVAGIDSLNQMDGIHPTAVGERLVAENVWQTIYPLLQAKGN